MRMLFWSDDAGLEMEAICGNDSAPYHDDVVRLRLEAFRDFPYLAMWSALDAKRYIEHYAALPDFRLAALKDKGKIVGFCTYVPLRWESEEMRSPLLASGLDANTIMYCDEIVIAKPYRGKKFFARFVEKMEYDAKALGLDRLIAVCVCRTPEHPLWPKGYIAFDSFMRKEGFAAIPGCSVEMTWPTVPDGQERTHSLQFWQKNIEAQ